MNRSPVCGRLARTALLLAVVTTSAAFPQGWRLDGLDGASLDSSQLSSGQFVLVFWASWSPRGRDVVERVAALNQQFGSRARFYLVNFQEDEATARQFLGNRRSVPVLLDRDGALAKRHAVLNLPGLVVFKNGQAVYSGRLPNDAAALLQGHLD